jgi:hypothetical protein
MRRAHHHRSHCRDDDRHQEFRMRPGSGVGHVTGQGAADQRANAYQDACDE